MKKLSVSIPNYNRISELTRLLEEIIDQINEGSLYDEVQICVSDDHSTENPTYVIDDIKKRNPDIEIRYERKAQNEGMDSNFLSSVMMSDAEYCWIIGNDDIPEKNGIANSLKFINEHKDCDFLVTPFDVYSEDNVYRDTIFPLYSRNDMCFDTRTEEKRKRFFLCVKHNSGIFGFLSNVIFRRSIWEEREGLFVDKMNSIFIQMYINIDALLTGAILYYSNEKIIKNYSDDNVGNSVERMCKILIGLDGVVEYFFIGDEKEHFKKVLTDPYIFGDVWDVSKNEKYRNEIEHIDSPKNRLYKEYFISNKDIKKKLKGFCVYIFGAGVFGKKALEILKEHDIEVCGIFDSDDGKQGHPFGELYVRNIAECQDLDKSNTKCYMIVASNYYLCEMFDTICQYKTFQLGIIT